MNEVVSIATQEGQIPVTFTAEPEWEALVFPLKEIFGALRDLVQIAQRITYFNKDRKVPMTPVKFVHSRINCHVDRFVSNPQYIFHSLD